MIDLFAQATGDHQWIHTDPERAGKESPYKAPIAHGFLTLSLAPRLMAQLYRIESVKMGINYGANKIRFTNAVPVNSRLRMRGWLHHTEPQNNGLRVITECVFEVEGADKTRLYRRVDYFFARVGSMHAYHTIKAIHYLYYSQHN